MSKMDISSELKPDQIIHHAGRDTYYRVINRCLMKFPDSEGGWEDGLAYISATKIAPGSYTWNLEDLVDNKVFVRRLKDFDSDWAIVC